MPGIRAIGNWSHKSPDFSVGGEYEFKYIVDGEWLASDEHDKRGSPRSCCAWGGNIRNVG
eukprot:3334311-Amphidinium_carterae.1